MCSSKMSDPKSDYRLEVLDAHQLLEDAVNTWLEMAFQISLPKSFSNNYTKLDLLMDLDIVDDDFKSKFQLFSRIRNKFIHEMGCYRFTNLSEGMRKQLLASQKMSYDHIEENERLFEAYNKLFKELLDDFWPRAKKALKKGTGDRQKLMALNEGLERLIDYICKKYPDENEKALLKILSNE